MRSSGRPPIFLTLLAALAGNAWVLDLPFRPIDAARISSADAILREELGMLRGDRRPGAPNSAPAGQHHRFQPLARMALVAGQAAQAVPIIPRTFHATSLALHGLAVVALLVGLRRWLPGGAALVGALVFALHPGGSEALADIAAQGDILVTLLALLSWLGCQRAEVRPMNLRWAGVAGLALALAIMSGESALPGIPILIGLLIWHRRHARRRILGLAVFLIPVAAVICWRQAGLGAWDLAAMSGGADPLAASGDFPGDVHRLLARLLVPWRDTSDPKTIPWLADISDSATAAIPNLSVAAFSLVAVMALLFRPRLAWPGMLGAALALACVLARALPESDLGRDHDEGGALYPAMPPFAVFLAAAGAALADAGRSRRAARVILAIGGFAFAVVSIDALVHTARAAAAEGRWIHGQVKSVETEARPLPADGVVLVVSSPSPGDAARGGVPELFRPPFRPRALDVRRFSTLADVLSGPHGLRGVRPPVVVLEERRDGWIRIAGPLPPIPDRLPDLVLAGASALFRPDSQVPMRAVAAMQVFLPSGASAPVRLVVRAEGDEIHFPLDGAPADPEGDLLVFFDVKPELSLSPGLREVEFEGLGAAAEGLRPPLLLAGSPMIRLIEPVEGARWRLRDRLRFVFRSPVDAARYRVEFQVVIQGLPRPPSPVPFMIYEFPATAPETIPGGLLSWPPHSSQWVEASLPELRLENLPALYDRLGRPAEIWDVTLRWRVFALGEDSRSRLSRSAWSSFTWIPD